MALEIDQVIDQVIDPGLARLVDQVQTAQAQRGRLNILGGSTKAFYGGAIDASAQPLDMRVLSGISSYEPTELVITALAGTPLAELEAALAEYGQCLPFEPPRFASNGTSGGTSGGTVGGMVASGLAGPARAAVGGLRDYVLGATLLNGRGELLNFGGTVIKNVAGYDVSRMLAGSMGMLGAICEVSLKVLPIASARCTLRLEMSAGQAIERLNEWGGQPLPLNASACWEGMLVMRLSGAVAAVRAAREKLGGEVIDAPLADAFWQGLRDHSDEFFVAAQRAVEGGAGLWRLSVPSTVPPLALPGEQLVEWGGAQRWLCTALPAQRVREAAVAAGGHATLFRARDKPGDVFTPLAEPLARIHRELKAAFDPDSLFNHGRLVPGL